MRWREGRVVRNQFVLREICIGEGKKDMILAKRDMRESHTIGGAYESRLDRIASLEMAVISK